MIDVYAVNICHKLNESQINHLMSFLSEEKQKRIKKFLRPEDVQRSLIADILIRMISCKSLGIRNKDIVFDQNEYGKPYLWNHRDFHFNISHAGEWVVGATHALPVGIDIEYIKSIDFDIAKRFFSKEEYNDLMNKDSAQKLSYFYELWTLKECYIKAVGKGLSIPLDSFTIKIDEEGHIPAIVTNGSDNYYFRQYDIDKDYKMAVCAGKNEFSDNVKVSEIKELFAEAFYMEEMHTP